MQLRFALTLIAREQEREGLPGCADSVPIKVEHRGSFYIGSHPTSEREVPKNRQYGQNVSGSKSLHPLLDELENLEHRQVHRDYHGVAATNPRSDFTSAPGSREEPQKLKCLLYRGFRVRHDHEGSQVVAAVAVTDERVGQLRQLHVLPAALVGYEESGAGQRHLSFRDPSGRSGLSHLSVHTPLSAHWAETFSPVLDR